LTSHRQHGRPYRRCAPSMPANSVPRSRCHRREIDDRSARRRLSECGPDRLAQQKNQVDLADHGGVPTAARSSFRRIGANWGLIAPALTSTSMRPMVLDRLIDVALYIGRFGQINRNAYFPGQGRRSVRPPPSPTPRAGSRSHPNTVAPSRGKTPARNSRPMPAPMPVTRRDLVPPIDWSFVEYNG